MSQKDKELDETDDYLVINVNDLKKLRVSELKEKLTEFGLQTKGTKPELITRLEEHLAAAAESEEELALIDVANTSQQSDCIETIDLDSPIKQKVINILLIKQKVINILLIKQKVINILLSQLARKLWLAPEFRNGA